MEKKTKTLGKLKLNQLSKNELEKRAMKVLKGGCDDFKILCASINLMVCDGDSLRIFLKEFTEGLNNKKLPFGSFLC